MKKISEKDEIISYNLALFNFYLCFNRAVPSAENSHARKIKPEKSVEKITMCHTTLSSGEPLMKAVVDEKGIPEEPSIKSKKQKPQCPVQREW